MKTCLERLYNGIIKENPTFVLMLGMCPTLAVTGTALNGLGMGISTMAVLTLSNLLISLLRKLIPGKVRIPAYIVIIASFVTVAELLMKAYFPGLYSSLGLYISLIVVNCIILGRAESYASVNKPLPALFDGIGMGLGFTLALTLIGAVREFIGCGSVFGFSLKSICGETLAECMCSLADIMSKPGSGFNLLLHHEFESFGPISIAVTAPGAFFILAIIAAIRNKIADRSKAAVKTCGDCATCGGNCSEITEDSKEESNE